MKRALRSGQVMILTILALGGTLLGATTIAGLLMVYQIRQATDLTNSGKAIFAADTGIEWGLYQFFNPGSSHPAPTMSNGSTYAVVCAPQGTSNCTDVGTTQIKSQGTAANVQRAFELNL